MALALLINAGSLAYAESGSTTQRQTQLDQGRSIFDKYCVLCHGAGGKGDGRLSKAIQNPPPADLTLSRQDDRYLHIIISQGGEAMGRSEKMPAWGDQLSDDEVADVVFYIKSLRD